MEHILYADQNKPSLLVQEIIVNNHAVSHIEIINNTRAGIVIFFRSKKRERAIGGQIQVPGTLT